MSGVPSWVRVGAKCICIDGAIPPESDDDAGLLCPDMGEECEIDGIRFDRSSRCWLTISGYDWVEYEWFHFRPAVCLDEDIGRYFEHHLHIHDSQSEPV